MRLAPKALHFFDCLFNILPLIRPNVTSRKQSPKGGYARVQLFELLH
jgi:hypothetical protein